MIQDVDESLRALVKRDALNGSKADIAFDAPNKEWSSRRNTPTVDLYLYDLREDLEQREVWSALGGELKSSLDLVVNAPFEIKVAIAAGPPVLEEPRFSFAGPDGESEDATTPAARGGRARRGAAAAEAAKPVGAPGPGGPKASGRLKPGEPANKPGVPPDQEEMVHSGKEKQPGRILRIRGVNRS